MRRCVQQLKERLRKQAASHAGAFVGHPLVHRQKLKPQTPFNRAPPRLLLPVVLPRTPQAAEAQVEQQQRVANSHLGVFGQQAVSEVKQASRV